MLEKSPKTILAGHFLYEDTLIEDTFAEMFGMWVGRILITAENQKWANTAAKTATGFASSIIMSPAEAGIERVVQPANTPDGRAGVLIQIYHRTRFDLKAQMILRIGQCIMTCPTTAAFDALPEAKRRLKVGRSLRLFGDGFQKKDVLADRKVWRLPVMEGEFMVEDKFGAAKAIAGGNLIIMAQNSTAGLQAAEKAAEAINKNTKEVIMPFPGGICRAGSKAGSINYKLKASTNHPFCPKLKELVADSQVPDGVRCIYEIVINGLDLDVVKKAMAEGIKAAVKIPGVVRISAGNYGGKLGPYHAYLKEVLGLS
ncbi:MAG: formylmethanofuran--tetrahydromethanopterin N-formyltransferase [Candidatus Bathyarchaeota archaeon]|nr:formylmethanofuran--tetrahydromethanopterin N-formyltransferase [Candidatus Bathyarchaeota archaeon]MDH5494396.1 formylmethanofuran--tetrahydromethanopterin N-formyltransferase [Candidatus Bathyarchaeota archaeon]